MQIPCAERRVCCLTATEHRRTTSRCYRAQAFGTHPATEHASRKTFYRTDPATERSYYRAQHTYSKQVMLRSKPSIVSVRVASSEYSLIFRTCFRNDLKGISKNTSDAKSFVCLWIRMHTTHPSSEIDFLVSVGFRSRF